MNCFRVVLFLVLGVSCLSGQAREIPIVDFFRPAEFTSVSLSPTGEYITVSVPQEDRTVLAAFRVADMELVGKWDWGKDKHIDSVLWVNDERFFMYVTEKTGRFDFRVVQNADVFASNVDGKRRSDIPNGYTYRIVDLLEDDPRHILVSRSIDSAYLSKMDVYDGSVRTVAMAPIRFGTFLVDDEANVRYAVGEEETLETVVLRRDGDSWTTVHKAAMGGSVYLPVAFGKDKKRVLFAISDKGEPTRLASVDPSTGDEIKITSNPNVNPGGWLWSSDDELLAVRYWDGFPKFEFVQPEHEEAKALAGLLNAFPDHAIGFGGISDDGRYILFTPFSDVDPGSYYLFDRQTGKARFLLSAMSWIKSEEMSPMLPIDVTARDGTKLHGYITIPRGSDGKNLPLILHPHGGPYGPRDYWAFNPEVQFLASRGYAVLQINFRGSGGYGNGFQKSGYKKWGTAMIDDMADAVDWAVRQGIADKDRICTYGASYGGYAALQSVVRYPDKYKCTIGYVGVYSLPLLFDDGSADSEAGENFLDQTIPDTVAEQQAQSPAYNIDKINVPVMLVHGAKDKIVPIEHYDLMLDRLTEAGKPPEITVVEDKEAHGFRNVGNNVELHTKMEAFLDKHIGDDAAGAGGAAE